MTKQEIIEAINATIVPNGTKAITAESLANLLIEMANATPEGGGSAGAGQVLFYVGTPNDDLTVFVLTPEEQAHNAEMVQVVKNSPIALSASVDATALMIAEAEEFDGVDATGVKYNLYSRSTMYVPTHIAELEGFPCAGVVAITEFPLFIAEDGSVSVAF